MCVDEVVKRLAPAALPSEDIARVETYCQAGYPAFIIADLFMDGWRTAELAKLIKAEGLEGDGDLWRIARDLLKKLG